MVEERWTKEKAFAHFGAKATNSRWGWSARNENKPCVVLTVWDDEFDPALPNGALDMFGHKNLGRWATALGNKDRIKNLVFARDHCDGEFRVVMVTAKDIHATPRSTRRLYPHPTLVMRLTDLNERTGEFRAVRVDQTPK